MSRLDAVGRTICPRISFKRYTVLVTKFKGVMFRSIYCHTTNRGLGSVLHMRSECGVI